MKLLKHSPHWWRTRRTRSCRPGLGFKKRGGGKGEVSIRQLWRSWAGWLRAKRGTRHSLYFYLNCYTVVFFFASNAKGGSRTHWAIHSLFLEKQNQNKKTLSVFFIYYLFKNWKIKRWGCSSGPHWPNCPRVHLPQQEGEGEMKERGRPTKHFFFFFFSFKVTAILGVGAEIKPSGHLDSFWGG